MSKKRRAGKPGTGSRDMRAEGARTRNPGSRESGVGSRKPASIRTDYEKSAAVSDCG